MTKNRIALFIGAILILAACGTEATLSPDATQAPATTQPETTIPDTTVPDVADTTLPPTTSTVPATTTTTSVPDSDPEGVEVMVYLVGGPDADPDNYDCSLVSPVVRVVEPPATLAGAMQALLAGATADELAAGYDSWFSEEVGWELESAIIADGVARIDFSEDSPFINNASTSCGSFSFLGQLTMTATQFPAVDEVIFSIGGDAQVFYEWLQRDVPEF
ncbi:MAG: GerMN domain-containing protein [Acidimicrobiia bacterium]|nr:GerMN domain-containing protein [Acidimicrobiia bacterium]